MAEHSTIEWTDATWNPITGCSVVSPGCTNCYAMRLAGTRMQNHPSRVGLTLPSKAGPVWTGEVRLNEDWLTQPLRWKRPRRVFVCAHGDLFHGDVPDEWIDRVFATMALCPQHTFQPLTKRSARMRSYNSHPQTPQRIARVVLDMLRAGTITGADALRPLADRAREEDPEFVRWPLANVHLGVSAEDQPRADERIPDLLATPAAVRFVSCEPLLGSLHLGYLGWPSAQPVSRTGHNALIGSRYEDGKMVERVPRLDWVIVGGESGASARPMHPDWVRSLRDQCAAVGTAFFFKQWGEWRQRDCMHVSRDHAVFNSDGSCDVGIGAGMAVGLLKTHVVVERMGKAAAGRVLDGVQHNGMPEVRR